MEDSFSTGATSVRHNMIVMQVHPAMLMIVEFCSWCGNDDRSNWFRVPLCLVQSLAGARGAEVFALGVAIEAGSGGVPGAGLGVVTRVALSSN